MKQFNNFINEKLRISSKKYKSIDYKYHPKTKEELRVILEVRLRKDKNADLNDIDVSDITDMHYIDNKNSMHGLFFGLDPHNINVSKWDVSKVEDMCCLFYGCQNLNCDISDWDVGKVNSMWCTFYSCITFNCDLSYWDLSKAEDMTNMFCGCSNFTGEGLENWNTSNVKKMFGMFRGCENLKCNLDNWNVSNVKEMNTMFIGCPLEKNPPSWYKE